MHFFALLIYVFLLIFCLDLIQIHSAVFLLLIASFHQIYFFNRFSTIIKIITHPARGRCEDVVVTIFSQSRRHRRYVSNETPNKVLVERRQDASVVRLQDIIKERLDNVSRVRNNDASLVRLHEVSN